MKTHRAHPPQAFVAIAAIAAAPLLAAASASAGFVGYSVNSAANGNLVTYRVSAQFNSSNDTVLRAFQLHAVQGDLGGFYHNDIVSSGTTTAAGSWNANFGLGANDDSYLVIGGNAGLNAGNSTVPDAGWINGWNTPAIPDYTTSGIAGYYNSVTENMQGKADANGRVLLAQFVLAANSASKTISLKIEHNTTFGSPTTVSTGSFSIPAPGALALLALAGIVGRRRR